MSPTPLSRSFVRACAAAARSSSRPTAALRPAAAAAFASTRASSSSSLVSSRPSSSTRAFTTSVARFAEPTPEPSDKPTPEFQAALEAGARALEEGAFDQARREYLKALGIHRDATVLFNLGVVNYCLKDHDAAISSWLESIALDPMNSDAHTNLASAYIISKTPKGHLALKHLRAAHELAPLDPEINFNLAAVLEALGQFEEALKMYECARTLGVTRASENVRSLGAKMMASAPGEEKPESK